MAELDCNSRNRPDPDALLQLAGKGGRGKLTVFLGAAPGVGKTYAMLARARRLKEQGVDIVVGLVETHGRAETAALMEGLELVPRRSLIYRDRTVEEFDLDAALVRHPRIIIVDELAHTNAPDSRHPKRHQDIEELVKADIDVWTAINVQHLESLNDVVTRITGVEIREIVPDIVLQKADEVLLVDLPTTELIARLNEGKVYLPGNAQRAAEGFFKPGNLTALRELALRRTADRVDDQMVDFLRQNAIEGPWETSERLLVCVGPDALSDKVVRTASRLASGLNAPWLVVSVERAGEEAKDADSARHLDETFRLAERLGAETRRVTGQDFVTEILKLARRENATQIVIGSRRAAPRHPFRRPSLHDAIMAQNSGLGIHIVTDKSGPVQKKKPFRPFKFNLGGTGIHLLAAAGSVTIAVLAGLVIDALADLPNLSMIFLMAVLICAIYVGRLAAVAAALLSLLAYNFFFIPPTHTFTISQAHEVFALVIFVAVALLAGSLAARVREQAQNARARAAETQALFEFSRKLSGTVKSDDVLWAAVTQLQATLKRSVVLLLPEDGELQPKAVWPPDTELLPTDMVAVRWAFDKKEPAGNGTGTLPNIDFQFRPIMTPHGAIGVCGFSQGDHPLEMAEDRAMTAIIDQTAIAIDRARLARESLEKAALQEGEKFRTALLSSISHDLRTPLATITGAVTTLRQFGEKMDAEGRDDLLASIEEEGARLSRFVSNLLDMTRIEAGTLNAKRDWVDVADVIRTSVERAEKYFPARTIETRVAPDLPLMRGDSTLLGQVLFNLLDNANKYGAEDGPTSIFARSEGGEVVISVVDYGKGIPEADLGRIFDKFFRRGKADGRAPGTGLGLSISRGFVEAMGGRIKAESPAQKKRGTRIVMRFPAAQPKLAEKDAP
jgi:two-component system sensor histidine kinase KdpD